MSLDAPTVVASIGLQTLALRGKRSRCKTARWTLITSAWAARWDCINRLLVPSDTAAPQPRFQRRSSGCCGSILRNVDKAKTCASSSRVTVMRNYVSACRESLWRWWRVTFLLGSCHKELNSDTSGRGNHGLGIRARSLNEKTG